MPHLNGKRLHCSTSNTAKHKRPLLVKYEGTSKGVSFHLHRWAQRSLIPNLPVPMKRGVTKQFSFLLQKLLTAHKQAEGRHSVMELSSAFVRVFIPKPLLPQKWRNHLPLSLTLGSQEIRSLEVTCSGDLVILSTQRSCAALSEASWTP